MSKGEVVKPNYAFFNGKIRRLKERSHTKDKVKYSVYGTNGSNSRLRKKNSHPKS